MKIVRRLHSKNPEIELIGKRMEVEIDQVYTTISHEHGIDMIDTEKLLGCLNQVLNAPVEDSKGT